MPYQKAPILTQPDLAVEVLSPDDAMVEMLDKVGDYLRSGVPHIWLVDPYQRAVVDVNRGDIRRVSGLIVETPLVGRVDFGLMFEEFDETC